MKRTFKQFTITTGGVPQPLVGTTLTTALAANPDGSRQTLVVGDSSIFQDGDYVIVGTGSPADDERGLIDSIPDATHITVTNLFKAHAASSGAANGVYVRSGILIQRLYVQTKKVNTASIFLGTTGMNKTGLVKVIAELLAVGAGVQPIDWTDPLTGGPNGEDLGEYWIDGTTGDGYLPSCSVL